MRHGKKFNHLGRTAAHRKAMLSNMACSLIEHKRINTTVAKAKELKKFVEPLVTRSKVDSTHNRRIVFSYLKNKHAVSELFREVVAKVGERPGGYTRIIKTGNRLGDNAEMCMIELVDFNELYTNEKAKTKKSRRSRRAGGSKKAEAPVTAKAEVKESAAEETVAPQEETATEEVKAEEPSNEAVEAKTEEAPVEEASAPEKEEAAEAKAEETTTEAKEEAASEEKEEKEDTDSSKEEKED
jgi:large subunit ribosomal protein L17